MKNPYADEQWWMEEYEELRWRKILNLGKNIFGSRWMFIECEDGTAWWKFGIVVLPSSRNFSLDRK